ncbi:MAG TPA: hypothetical protein VFP42_06180 [Acidimicrobiia bacterium]|nr:hypothetical protein [Acidimicrobiia bacterium]
MAAANLAQGFVLEICLPGLIATYTAASTMLAVVFAIAVVHCLLAAPQPRWSLSQ